MIKKSLYFCLAVVFFLSACSFSHNKKYVFPGKYKTRILGENKFEVSFVPSRSMDTVKANNLALLKCATTTLENGYRYFLISKQVVEKTFFSSKKTTRLIILCFADIPKQTEEDVYDAQQLKDYIELKYNLKKFKYSGQH